ncbi:MAG TPA: LapA family protein [Steroidobacteraceae bacterium]|jgi:lipopolysaccharide assembly protein A|nr:LapA family protein [Steroidobacteraceae bacterium]HJY38332.1 LapA family protein [Steroidobacteraceae bacterium]
MTPIRIAALILVLLLAVAFAVQNTGAVNVSLLLWKSQASLAIVMALCLALGFLVGLLAVAPSFFKGRRHARNLQRQLAKLDTDAVSASQPSPMSADVAARGPSERQVAR